MLARIKKNERVILWLCLAFSLVLLAFFGLGWNLDQTLRNYLVIAALGIILVFAWQKLGYRKDRHFLRGNISRSIIVTLISYAIVAYLLGLFLGFNRGYISTDISKLIVGFIPTLVLAIILELTRYVISSSYQHSRWYVVFFTTLSSLLYILIELNVARLESSELRFVFICSTVMPIIAREALCGFLAFKIGLLPTLLFKLPLVLYPYLLPIVPDLGDYIHAVANIILPFVIYVVTNNSLRYYEKDKKQLRSINYRIITIPVLVIGIVLTILVSGIFSLQLIAVGSDSMRPVFSRGDAVLFEKVSASEIAKDDILVFRREGVIVTHRVVSIESRSGMLYFTTRGDANDSNDNFETSSEQVLGRVIMVGKYIGYPTVWLNEIFNQG